MQEFKKNENFEVLAVSDLQKVTGGDPDSFNELGSAVGEYIRNGGGGSSTGALRWNAPYWQMC